MAEIDAAWLTIAELREFAGFTRGEQRYIKRSLDLRRGRRDMFQRWARSDAEAAAMRAQATAYRELEALHRALPEGETLDERTAGFMARLMRVTASDLAQGELSCFSAYRFLYERLLGPRVRPWLPSAFCAAAALPQIRPGRRKRLLHSISEAAATAPRWSGRAPTFYPVWVEDEAA